MGFLEVHCSNGSKMEPPPPRKRSAVVEWPPGWLRKTSVVFLLSNLGLPDQGLGTWLGESLACSPRVVEGFCSWTPPSGCPTALGQEGPRQGIFGNPVDIFGRDTGVSSLAVSRSSLRCYSLGRPPCR